MITCGMRNSIKAPKNGILERKILSLGLSKKAGNPGFFASLPSYHHE